MHSSSSISVLLHMAVTYSFALLCNVNIVNITHSLASGHLDYF